MRLRPATTNICCLATLIGGCASTIGRVDITDRNHPPPPRWAVPIYPGLQVLGTFIAKVNQGRDESHGTGETLLVTWLFTGDVPISFAADTLLLPLDLVGWATRDTRRPTPPQGQSTPTTSTTHEG